MGSDQSEMRGQVAGWNVRQKMGPADSGPYIGHGEDFDTYSECDTKPLGDF